MRCVWLLLVSFALLVAMFSGTAGRAMLAPEVAQALTEQPDQQHPGGVVKRLHDKRAKHPCFVVKWVNGTKITGLRPGCMTHLGKPNHEFLAN
uniref:Uncharacterized protein n=1 Tax=Sphaerodactylus townsendi TaxID=933632 RepID=A0ACB8FXN0_9SAUR